jgi:alkanesulfonate monooxygenase SsuD/methylene tetrahydromethanopterin reductase-like flavin-dependent oxidoreductase (luciferase family)
MLEITARYADAWNTAWLGWPEDVLPGRIAGLHEACRTVGRDPAEIEITVGVTLGFPDLGYEDARIGDRSTMITGDAQEIAAAFRAHEAAGVGHLIVQPQPASPAGYDRLADAVTLYRRG